MRSDISRKIDKYVLPTHLQDLLNSTKCRKNLKKCTLDKFPRDVKSFGYKAALLTIQIEDTINRIHTATTLEEEINLKISLLEYCHWRIVCIQYLANTDTKRAMSVAKILKINFQRY